MRIKNKGLLVLGILNIMISVIGVVILIARHKIDHIPLLGICLVCGINSIIDGVETKAQRQKRKEELQALAKLYNWNKEE